MSKEKQIEEMAKVIKSSLDGLGSGNFNFTGVEISEMFAKALYNAGYRKQEWISVKDRLPKNDGDFLVWSDYYGVILGHYFARGRYFISKAVEVSHWMPLPEAPKMKGGNQ